MSATGDASKAILRLSKEKALVTSKPVPGVRFEPGSEEKPLEWVMFVDGPDEYVVRGERRKCPYAGRVFPVTLRFPNNYPFKAPEMSFAPGILYHPNVARETGDVCGDIISKAFSPTSNVTDLARLVVGFLATPNLESPLDPEVAAELATNISQYEDKARRAAGGAAPIRK